MIIDKTLAFYTEEDRAELERITAREDELNRLLQNSLDELELAKARGELTRDNTSASVKVKLEYNQRQLDLWTAEEERRNSIYRAIEQRYIDSLNKDPLAVLEDAKEILEGVELADFLEYISNGGRADIKGRYAELKRKKGKKTKDEKHRLEIYKSLIENYFSENASSLISYLCGVLRVQYNALGQWGYITTKEGDNTVDPENPADALDTLIVARAKEFYPEENITPIKIQPELPAERDYFIYPDSPVTDQILGLLGVSNNMPEYLKRQASINHGAKYSGRESEDQLTLSVKGRKEEFTITVPKSNAKGRENPVIDLFMFALMKTNEQALYGGVLTRHYIEFNLKELIEKGIYANIDTARRGYRAGAEGLISIKFSGERWISKKKKYGDKEGRVIFTGYSDPADTGGQCKIYLNTALDWRAIVAYYAIFPSYYFRLSRKGKALAYTIFYLARQNAKKIQEHGYFTISFKALQHRLGLPDENDSKHAYKIREGIDNAIEELEQAHSKYENNTELQLLPVYDPNWTTRQYLAEGYLKVAFTGSYKEEYLEIARRIERREQQQAKIIEKANIKALADHKKEQLEKTDTPEG